MSCSGRSTAGGQVRGVGPAQSSRQPSRSRSTYSTQRLLAPGDVGPPRAVGAAQACRARPRRAASSVGQLRSTGRVRNGPVTSTSASQSGAGGPGRRPAGRPRRIPSSHGLPSRHHEHDGDREAVRLGVGVAARDGGQLAFPVLRQLVEPLGPRPPVAAILRELVAALPDLGSAEQRLLEVGVLLGELRRRVCAKRSRRSAIRSCSSCACSASTRSSDRSRAFVRQSIAASTPSRTAGQRSASCAWMCGGAGTPFASARDTTPRSRPSSPSAGSGRARASSRRRAAPPRAAAHRPRRRARTGRTRPRARLPAQSRRPRR